MAVCSTAWLLVTMVVEKQATGWPCNAYVSFYVYVHAVCALYGGKKHCVATTHISYAGKPHFISYLYAYSICFFKRVE